MSIKTEAELRGMRAAGRVVAEALAAMRARVAPGVTTLELDAVAAKILARHGARSGPQLDYDFPGVTCISVGDEVVHGIPGDRRLAAGELVKLDVTVELDGFYADACDTVAVAPAPSAATRLVGAAQRALRHGLQAAIAGAPLNAIGAAVEHSVRRDGFSVCIGLTGHGIGRRIHEPPTVPNQHMAALREPLTDGLVIAIEPMIAAGSGAVALADDGWTVCTLDGGQAAHAEHTVMIRSGRPPLVLTAA
jgi:methionyl aminopeptidase